MRGSFMTPVRTWLGYPYPLGATWMGNGVNFAIRSEEHTSELQSQSNLVCRLLLEKTNPPLDPVSCAQVEHDRRRLGYVKHQSVQAPAFDLEYAPLSYSRANISTTVSHWPTHLVHA